MFLLKYELSNLRKDDHEQSRLLIDICNVVLLYKDAKQHFMKEFTFPNRRDHQSQLSSSFNHESSLQEEVSKIGNSSQIVQADVEADI